MMKDRIFYLIMFTIPLGVLVACFFVYMRAKSPDAPYATFEKKLFRSIEDDTVDKQAYVNNWKDVSTFQPVPFTVLHYKPNIRGHAVNTNDIGYRGTLGYFEMVELSKNIHSEGGKVVVFTGGSAAFGAYSRSDEDCIVGYLNRLAEGAKVKVAVFNFAMGLYTSDQELVALAIWAADLNPDLLIVMDGYNDALRITNEEYTLGAKIPYAYGELRASLGQFTDFPSSGFFARRYDVSADQAQLGEVLRVYGSNLNRMCHFMAGYGNKTILSVQPVRGYRNSCSESVEYAKRIHNIYGSFVRKAREVAEQCSAEFVDLTRVFEGTDDASIFFTDSVHMNSEGQKEVALTLFPVMMNELGLPISLRNYQF
ncbi:MAG: SGNH/GDSL hydrolase family protein [Thermodesulfobacteriota bacterium]|nr:SGNH/GDSL hydrolase family protein [Thermodesulfobacteriota bacterium]